MSLTLYFHPLSSFCHKTLIALYENATQFRTHLVDLMDPAERGRFRELWPIGKFPVLRDEARGQTVPESSVIIEYLACHYPGPVRLIPDDAQAALRVRSIDRFYDLHVHDPMQKIVVDRIRPEDRRDPAGVEEARERLRAALGIVEAQMAQQPWAAGRDFSMADCAAAPPLFFINRMRPLSGEYPNLARYLERLQKRPSYGRTLAEAEPYLSMFPG